MKGADCLGAERDPKLRNKAIGPTAAAAAAFCPDLSAYPNSAASQTAPPPAQRRFPHSDVAPAHAGTTSSSASHVRMVLGRDRVRGRESYAGLYPAFTLCNHLGTSELSQHVVRHAARGATAAPAGPGGPAGCARRGRPRRVPPRRAADPSRRRELRLNSRGTRRGGNPARPSRKSPSARGPRERREMPTCPWRPRAARSARRAHRGTTSGTGRPVHPRRAAGRPRSPAGARGPGGARS